MELVPAPGRQFKTYSMWIGILIGSFDALLLMLKAFADIHLLSAEQLLGINAVLGFLIVPAKLVLQNIPVTTEQKVEIVASAAAQPMKAGETNVRTTIDASPTPASPGVGLEPPTAPLPLIDKHD